MSIKVMSMVFDRYPNGGGEMLLALSLADFAEDDGTRVFPSIKQLSNKTRQSERTVQYQLRRMEEMGWLILINSGNGGRNQRREYRINPAWIKGADIAPGNGSIKNSANSAPIERVQSEAEKGASDDIKGAIDGSKGCKPLHPHIPTIEPSIPIKETPVCKKAGLVHFEAFWTAYPNTARRVAKAKCAEIWIDRKLDLIADDILSHVRAMATTQQWLGGYEPAPLTYLNQKRWGDGAPTATVAKGASKHGNFNQQDYRAGVSADGRF